jgi:hypothetical protein
VTALKRCLAATLLTCSGWSVMAQVPVIDVSDLPIADVHFHYMAFMSPDELRARMDKHNVRWVVSAEAQGAAGAAGSPGAKNPWIRDSELKFELKDRFVAAVGGPEAFNGERRDGAAFYTDPKNLWAVAAVERMTDLLKQDRRTFVELFPNAENSSMEPMRRRRLPTNAPLFKEIMSLATQYKVPVPMHMEWHPESVAQLSELLVEFPQANVVLSHCGKTTVAEDLRPFFQKHRNVYCDLGYRSSPQGENESRKDPRRMIYWSSNLLRKADIKTDWLKLMEDFPDRFMLAIDDVVSWEQYDQVVAATREGVLAKLTPATAVNVAYRNAVHSFGLAVVAAVPASPTK